MPPELTDLASLGLPSDAVDAIAEFVREVEAVVPRLLGAYLHGSAARGAYAPPASDVDILLLLSGHCADDAIPRLVAAQASGRMAGTRIGAVCVTRAQLAAAILPVALDLVLPPDAEPQRDAANLGMMFPLDWQDAWECGVALSGPPVREVLTPAPREMLTASVAWLFPHLAANFKNPELMLCRAARVLTEGRLCSKPEAGRWALKVFDARWHGLIGKALAERERGGSQAVCSPEELADFQRACAELIQAATGVAL